jgi:hypothetical protein
MAGRHNEIILAECLKAVLASVPRRLRERLEPWLERLQATYTAQCLEPSVGPWRAFDEFRLAVSAGPPRKSRSAEDDARMGRLRAELVKVLEPFFPPNRHWRSLKARDKAIGPIVQQVLGRPAAVLPPRERLDGFVTELLASEYEFSVVRRSRAAGRERQRKAEQLARQERWETLPLTSEVMTTLKALRLGGANLEAALRHDKVSLLVRPSAEDPDVIVLRLERLAP